jgi:hypothetical protein
VHVHVNVHYAAISKRLMHSNKEGKEGRGAKNDGLCVEGVLGSCFLKWVDNYLICLVD